MSFLLGLLPSRAWLYGLAAAAIAAALAWLRMDASRDARREMEMKDHEHADEIREKADDARRRLDGDDADWLSDSPANRDRD